MANPQLENGFLKIANELVQALMRINLSSYQSRVIWAIWRKTYGYNKKEDHISNSQLVTLTGIRKQHVSRTIKELFNRNMVTKSGYKIAFNKDYTRWRELPKEVTLPEEVTKVTNSGYRVTNSGAHKIQYTKDNKNKYKEIFDSFWMEYPSRNGKKLEREETLKRFFGLKEEELPLVITAARNYAQSKLVAEGIGIKDPKRFLNKTYWREWITPETKPKRYDEE